MEFRAGKICTPSHLTSCAPRAAYPVTSAPDLVFALVKATGFFSMEHACVSRSLMSPAEPPETESFRVHARRSMLLYLPGVLGGRRRYRAGSVWDASSEHLTVNQSTGSFESVQSKV